MSDEVQTKDKKPSLKLVYAASNVLLPADTAPAPVDKSFALSLARSFDIPSVPSSFNALCFYLQEHIDFSDSEWPETTCTAVNDLERQTQFVREFGRDYLLNDPTDYSYAHAAVLLSCCDGDTSGYKNKTVRTTLNHASDLRHAYGSFFENVNTATKLVFMGMLHNEIETDLLACKYGVMDTEEITSRYLYQYAPIRNHIPEGSQPANFLRDAIDEIRTHHVALGKPAEVVRLPEKQVAESSPSFNAGQTSKLAKREIAPSPDHEHILKI